MKHLFFRSCLVFLAIIAELNAVAGDYDVRTSVVDGVEWTYQVLSEANRTCQLGDGSRNAHNAVSHHESELLTTPAQIDGYYVVAISPYAFANDSKLRGITLSEGIDIIGYGAFYHAENLEGISFPNSLRTIEYYAFRGCKTFFPRNPNLESISVAEGNSKYDSRKGCNALIETATNKIVQGCNNTVILDGIEIIGVIAFTECNGLNSIVLPATIRSIQGNAFLDCKNLLKVTCYAKEPYSISTNVFPKNTYTNGVLQVRKGSKELYEAKKPWSDFSNIVEIESPEIMSGDKFVADINGINLKYRVISTDDKTCVIGWPDDLHTPAIDPSSSGELRIPETINGYSVIEISDWSFYKCMNLTGIHIPASVRSFGTNTFLFCTGLTHITVALENKTFDSRENCNAIIHTSSNTLLLGCENTIIPNSVIVIGETAFFGCSGMTSVAIPIGVTEICQSAFAGCGISSLEIPEGVLSIGVGAFDNCKQLKEVTIPKSVISIGLQAFWACNALESVTSYIKNPFQIGDNTFATTSDGYDILPPIATLYVPEGTKSLYEQTPSWSLFPKIVEMSEEPIMKGDTNGDGVVNIADIVKLVSVIMGI